MEALNRVWRQLAVAMADIAVLVAFLRHEIEPDDTMSNLGVLNATTACAAPSYHLQSVPLAG